MALLLKDRVKETSTTSGTGAITLGGAVVGFQSFSAVLSDSDTTYYAISHRDADEWEVGLGTYSAGTLSRDTILESSNAGSVVSFSSGTKDVFITLPAEKAVVLTGADVLSVDTGSIVEGSNLFYTDTRANSAIDTRVTKTFVDGLNVDADTLDGQHGSYYTGYTDTAIANLIDTAPATLDTLNELAAALGDDPNFATTVTNNIATKVSKAGDTMTGNLSFGDNVQAKFGASDDLLIYHDGIASRITDQGTGNLTIRAEDFYVQDVNGSQTNLRVINSGSVALYHAGSPKVETQSYGVHTTGSMTASGNADVAGDVIANGNVTSGDGSGGVSLTVNDGQGNANVTFNHKSGIPEQNGNAARIVVNTDATSDSNMSFQFGSNVTGGVYTNLTNGAIFSDTDQKLMYNGGEKFATTSTGVDVTGTVVSDGIKLGNVVITPSGDSNSVHVNAPTGFIPQTTTTANNSSLGISSYRWKDVYAGGGDFTGNITVGGTVDGRDVSVDGAKLDGIEAGATADMSAGEILTAIKTVDGAGSGLDADTIDGIQATDLSRKVMETAGGTSSDANYWAKLATYSITGNYNDGTFLYYVMNEELGGGSSTAIISVSVRTNNVTTGQSNTVFVDIVGMPRAIPFNDNAFKLIDNGSGTDIELWVQKNVNYCRLALFEQSSMMEGVTVTYNNNAAWQATEPVGTGNNVRSNGLKYRDYFVWHSGNDGAGSGLDADTLDGIQAGSFLRNDTNGSINGILSVKSQLNVESPTDYGRIEVGGPSGGYIDFKAPFSDDYDGRIITYGSGLTVTAPSGVNLQHNNATKLATNSGGVNVTGNITASGVNVTGNITASGVATVSDRLVVRDGGHAATAADDWSKVIDVGEHEISSHRYLGTGYYKTYAADWGNYYYWGSGSSGGEVLTHRFYSNGSTPTNNTIQIYDGTTWNNVLTTADSTDFDPAGTAVALAIALG